MRCLNDHCKTSGIQSTQALRTHLEVCSFRQFKCNICGHDQILSSVSSHTREKCAETRAQEATAKLAETKQLLDREIKVRKAVEEAFVNLQQELVLEVKARKAAELAARKNQQKLEFEVMVRKAAELAIKSS